MTRRSPKKYRTICADPPWLYSGSRNGSFVIPKPAQDIGQRGVESMGYEGMPTADIEALRPEADDNAHLYLWTTNSFLVEAMTSNASSQGE